MSAVGEPGGLLVVAEYPGAEEDRKGEPLCGDSGRFIRKLVQTHWRGPFALDYSVRCAKGREKLPTNSVDQCRGYLLQTIKEVRPQRILAMGSTALMSFFGEALQPLSMRKSVAWLLDPNDTNNPDAALIPVFLFPNPVMGVRNRFVRR